MIKITIARRGKEAREEAPEQAINQAQENFENQWKISASSLVLINPAYPSQFAGLQVINYYLWAIQRLYERGEERFFRRLARKYRLIMDLDDKRNKPYGEWIAVAVPLTLEKLGEARSQ